MCILQTNIGAQQHYWLWNNWGTNTLNRNYTLSRKEFCVFNSWHFWELLQGDIIFIWACRIVQNSKFDGGDCWFMSLIKVTAYWSFFNVARLMLGRVPDEATNLALLFEDIQIIFSCLAWADTGRGLKGLSPLPQPWMPYFLIQKWAVAPLALRLRIKLMTKKHQKY